MPFDIYAIAPMGSKETKVTTRKDKAEAENVAKNLREFGYKNVRLVDREAPRPTPPAPPSPPAPPAK